MPSSLVEKINTIKDLVVESLNPDSVILFGSRAEGNCKKGSDIDLAVETSKRLPQTKKVTNAKD